MSYLVLSLYSIAKPQQHDDPHLRASSVIWQQEHGKRNWSGSVCFQVQPNREGDTNFFYPQDRSTRKKLGILLLSVVIVLWVSSNFLTYAIFSDDSYSKPYFVTYINTSVFLFYLIPWAIQKGPGWRKEKKDESSDRGEYYPVTQEMEQTTNLPREERLGTTQTMRLSAEFCLMWFVVSFTI